MKTKDYKKSHLSWGGMVSFFLLISFVMQVAILAYDYICQRTDDTGLIALLILILIFILSAFCTLCDFLRRKIMIDRPVRKILDTTEKISHGDFTVRIDIEHGYEKYTEFDYISENLNRMASELGKSEIMKNDFISGVSHELKTPLAVIGNYASALGDPTLDEESRARYSSVLVNASKRLSDLVTNILKLNKLENQQLKPEMTKINLSDMLAEAILVFEGKIEEKDIQLDLDLGEVFIFSSLSLLELVWNNLLSNAFKFTPEGGKVTLTLETTKEHAIVNGADTGCGMSPEVGAHIFEKFYRSKSSCLTPGTGLGLTIAHKVVMLHQGTINVTSEVGKGTSFIITLPK